jgi:hypothetical protein
MLLFSHNLLRATIELIFHNTHFNLDDEKLFRNAIVYKITDF